MFIQCLIEPESVNFNEKSFPLCLVHRNLGPLLKGNSSSSLFSWQLIRNDATGWSWPLSLPVCRSLAGIEVIWCAGNVENERRKSMNEKRNEKINNKLKECLFLSVLSFRKVFFFLCAGKTRAADNNNRWPAETNQTPLRRRLLDEIK